MGFLYSLSQHRLMLALLRLGEYLAPGFWPWYAKEKCEGYQNKLNRKTFERRYFYENEQQKSNYYTRCIRSHLCCNTDVNCI